MSEHNQNQVASNVSPKTNHESGDEDAVKASGTSKVILTSKNHKSVGTQNNVVYSIGTINVSTPEGKSKEDKPTFKDPTIQFPDKPVGLPTVPKAEVEKYFGQLRDQRLLMVDCFYEKTLHAAMYGLVDNTILENYEKRWLNLEKNQPEQMDLPLGTLVDKLADKKIGRGEKLVLAISLISSKSQRFLDSMFFEDSLYAQSIKAQLEKNDIMLVCFVKSGFFQETFSKKTSLFHFPRWNIPFLSHLLKSHFMDEEACHLLEKEVLRQRRCGLWDGNNSDSDFYGLVHGYLGNGVAQLMDEIEKRKRYTEGQDVREFLKSVRTVQVAELVQDDELVKNTVLYVATFFPELGRNDFDKLVSLLLEGEEEREKPPEVFVPEHFNHYPMHDYQRRRTSEERGYLKIWKTSKDKILKECHLKVVRSETGLQIMDFSFPHLRSELKGYLEQKSLYIHHFERIQQLWLLFDRNVSPKMIENLINLYAEMAVSDPNRYGENWLRETIIGIIQSLAIQLEVNASDDLEALMQLLAAELATEERRQQLRFRITRLAELIREMSNCPQLNDMIKNFLESLMEAKRYDVVLFIVLGIVKQLRFVSQFDGIYWVKQLIERGEKEDKKQAYNTLLEQATQSSFRVFELLDHLKTWLPERELAYDKYSWSNKYALTFIIDYAIETLPHFDNAHYGVWPSKYPLFATIRVTEEKELAQIDSLIFWIFHPGMQKVMQEFKGANFEEIDRDINILFSADLIEIWFKILYGLRKAENICPEVSTILERLFQQVAVNTNRSQRQNLMRRWWKRGCSLTDSKLNVIQRALKRQLQNEKLNITQRAQRQQLREEINKLNVIQCAERQRLRDEGLVILELYNRFNTLIKQLETCPGKNYEPSISS